MKIYEHLLFNVVIGITTLQAFGTDLSSKLEERLNESFDSIQITTNGLLLKPKYGKWKLTPLLSTTPEKCFSNEVVFIRFGKNLTLESGIVFSFMALDKSCGDGFFILHDRGRRHNGYYGLIRKEEEGYTILDGQGVPVHFWTYAKESGLLEMLNAHTDTPILPPPSVTNQVVQVKEPHSKTTPIKKIIPPKTKPQRLEKVKSTSEVSIPKEPVTEQPSQMKKNLTLPISIGGFLILLGGWFFWKKGQ